MRRSIPMFSSAKRAHAIHPPVHQILSQLRVEMEMMPVPADGIGGAAKMLKWGQNRCEVAQREPVRRGEECADKINMEACLNTVGECRRCCRSQIRTHTVARVRSVQVGSQRQMVIHADSHPHEKCPTKPRETEHSQEL